MAEMSDDEVRRILNNDFWERATWLEKQTEAPSNSQWIADPQTGKTWNGIVPNYTGNNPSLRNSPTNRAAQTTLANAKVQNIIDTYTPQVKINGDKTGLVVTGSKTALDSKVTKDLQKYLDDTFKYADLNSVNVADSIEKINKDLRDQISKSVAESTKFNTEYYSDYLNALETMRRQNPMNLEGDEARKKYGIWGYDKDGNRVRKLPQEWIDYWREKYSSKERAALFDFSRKIAKGESDAGQEVLSDFNLWTPYLVMSGGEGGDSPMYGFDLGEQLVGGAEAFVNEINKLGKGIQDIGSGAAFFLSNPTGYLRRNFLNDMAHSLGHKDDVLSKEVKWLPEDQWKAKLDSLSGKKVSDLTTSEQAFLATTFAGKGAGVSFDENTVIDENIINQGEYNDYINSRDNLSTLEDYDKRRGEIAENAPYDWSNLEDETAAAQIYAPINVGAGAFSGVILRTFAESGLISGLTGGMLNLTNIGDNLADGIIKLSSAGGKAVGAEGIANALNRPLGKFLLTLATEIPEDVVQTAVDNVIIGNGEENLSLLTPENIAQNTLENLIFRAVFGAGTRTLDYVSTRNTLKRLRAQAPELKTVDPDVLFGEYNEFKKARADGSRISFDEEGRAVITDENGNTKTLENVKASAFNNTGDAQLDAIGEAWRTMHDIDEKSLDTKNLENIKTKIDSDIDSTKRRISDLEKQADDAKKAETSSTARTTEAELLQKSQEIYDTKKARLESIKDSDSDMYNSRMKAAGMEKAALDRLITGDLTARERSNFYDRYEKIFSGKDVVVDGKDAVVTNPSVFGRVKVEFADGTTKTVDAENIKPKYTSEEDVRNDIFRKFIQPEIERQLGVKFDNNGDIIGGATIPTEVDGAAIKAELDTEKAKLQDLETQRTEIDNRINDNLSQTATIGEKELSSDAPSSASIAWESPRIGKSYYSKGDSVQSVTDKIMADAPSDPTQLNNWHANSEASIMEAFDANFVPSFQKAYTTPTDQTGFVSNMDYLFWLQRKGGKTLEIKYKTNAEPKSVIPDELKPYARNGELDFGKENGADTLIKKISGDTDAKSKSYYEKEYKEYNKELKRLKNSKELIDETGMLDMDKYQAAAEQIANKYFAPIEVTEKNRDMTMLGSLLVDSAPSKDFLEVQSNLDRVIHTLRSEGVTDEIKTIVDDLDSTFTQKMNSDMVLYRGEPDADFNNAIKVGDPVGSSAYTYVSPFKDYVGPYRAPFGRKGGVLYRYHAKAGQPVFYAPSEDVISASEMMLPRNINAKVTKISSNPAGKVFGKFVPEKIVDVEVVPTQNVSDSALSNGTDIKISGTAVGATYESDGLTYKVNNDDIKFYVENIEPMMKPLRDASQAALGVDVPTYVGYFPHTDYSPQHMTAEELIDQGVLYREFSGESVMIDGNFTTAKLTDDIRERYRVFVNNMLWDAAGDRVAAARLMEEFHADGLDVTPEQANTIIASRKAQADDLRKSKGAKMVKEHLDSDKPKYDYKEIQENIQKSSGGYAQRLHDGFGGVYGTARGTYAQPKVTKLVSNSDWQRGMQTPDGSLYDNGGRMVMAGDADAGFLAKRIFEENITGQQLNDLFVEYLAQNGRRTAKGAQYIADKWVQKLMARANNQPISRASLAADLQQMIYFEGVSRVNRWVARADLSNFSKSNIGALDSFLYRQGVITRQLTDSTVMGKINSATNKIINARMKSLFWFNFKNGVLQLSECIRLFTEFDMGDARATIRRLATDADFRREVDEWVRLIVPEKYTDTAGVAARSKMLEGTSEAMGKIAGKSSLKNGALEVEKMTAQDIKDLGAAFDKFASSPVDFGENTKNHIIMAGIIQEAQRKGLTGNELFNYVNKRFERVGLAANDMGKLTASDNPFFRIATNLQSFGIREVGMYINNIRDLNDASGLGAAFAYIIKNLGWKGGLLLIMSKLGYGALSVMGLDPFGLMDDQYTGVDEEDYNFLDRVVSNPAVHALFSGGFTSFLPQLYWATRQAYEGQVTPEEDMERALKQDRQTLLGSFEWAGLSFDDIRKIGMGFVPGYTQTQRVISMTDLLNRGWATGATGNKKYQAPDNFFDAAAGYMFGPSNTPNARAYNQTPDYLQGLLEGGLPGLAQQWGREWGGYRQFDPLDGQNYSDWFNGSKADEAQWRAGYYHFRNRMQDILSEYSKNEKTANDSQIEGLKATLNNEISKLQDQVKSFTDAYVSKHPEGIDEEKMNNLINILNTYQSLPGETIDERTQRKLDEWNDALNRYSQAGLPQTTTYKGTDDGTEVVYSPQVRSALEGRFGLPEEASARIKELYDDRWKKLNQQYRDRYFNTKGSKAKKAIQEEYISIIRRDLDPLVQLYGAEIFSNDTVEDIVEDVFNSMIPKYGQTAKSYLKNLYKGVSGQVRYSETGKSTLEQIDKKLNDGRVAQAKALARTLLQRVQENRAFLTREELERLQKILND